MKSSDGLIKDYLLISGIYQSITLGEEYPNDSLCRWDDKKSINDVLIISAFQGSPYQAIK